MWMLRTGWLLLLGMALAGCAAARMDRTSELQQAQYAYSAAIRWGDFEGAWNMVDPKYRQDHPMTDLQFERYKQVQISGYHDLGTQAGEGTATRDIQIGVINRNTLVERNARYTERWRYDPAGTWWLTVGLPDLWQGE